VNKTSFKVLTTGKGKHGKLGEFFNSGKIRAF